MNITCVACNITLDEFTLRAKKVNGEPEDMCSNCRTAATAEYSFLSDHEWGHSASTGDAPTTRDNYYYDFFDS